MKQTHNNNENGESIIIIIINRSLLVKLYTCSKFFKKISEVTMSVRMITYNVNFTFKKEI